MFRIGKFAGSNYQPANWPNDQGNRPIGRFPLNHAGCVAVRQLADCHLLLAFKVRNLRTLMEHVHSLAS